jgi:predicted unusual protein kinase regulating ubiquinone biosynthesis (AarF/ABC1/UbiB family)
MLYKIFLLIQLYIVVLLHNEKWIKNTISQLGIVFIKICQWLSNFDKISNSQFSFLSQFQTNCNYNYPLSIHNDYIKKNIINIESYTSGSVGMIYKGFHIYEKKIVILKILHPWIYNDLKTWKKLCHFIQYWKKIDMNDIFQVLECQFDFTIEAKNMNYFKTLYNNNILYIPKVFYAEKNILICEFVETKSDLDKYEKMEKNILMKTWILDQIMIHNCLHGDLHNGNWGYTDSGIVLFDFGYIFQNMKLDNEFYLNILKKKYDNIIDKILDLFQIIKTPQLEYELNEYLDSISQYDISFLIEILKIINKNHTLVLSKKLLFIINLTSCIHYLNQNENIGNIDLFMENCYILCKSKHILDSFCEKIVFDKFLLH